MGDMRRNRAGSVFPPAHTKRMPVLFKAHGHPQKALRARRVPLLCFIVSVLLLASLGRAAAHGVGYRQAGKKTVALEFYYSTGETMAYQEFRVYQPDDDKNPFQSGRTDESGRCSFIPEKAGTWRVAVRDGEGHSAEASVSVTPEFLDGGGDPRPAAVSPSLPEGTELFFRAALGVSLLFNIASLIRVIKLRKLKKLEKCI